jgi:hypothetical protein
MAMLVLLTALALAPAARARVELPVDSLTADRERPVRGVLSARCGEGGSVLELQLEGLEPRGRYSLWMFVYARTNASSPAEVVAAGTLGRSPAHEFDAAATGRAHLVVHQRGGALSSFGSATACLLDTPQWRIVGGLHPGGVRAGAHMPAAGEIVEQFGVTYIRPSR